MQNEEKMLTIEDAYDAAVDFLEKLCDKTKSEQVIDIVSEMPLVANGKSIDPATLENWHKAIEKTLNHNSKTTRQNFELIGKNLTIKQAYEVMINFLDMYTYFTEIVAILSNMRPSNDGIPADPAAWTDWMESVNKILSQNPRNRPLFFGVNSKILTADDAYYTTIDWLSKYYNKTKANDIKVLMEKTKCLANGESSATEVLSNWNKAVSTVLNNEPIENGLDAKEAYTAVINFLDKYNHKVNSNEIVTLINGMKMKNELESSDPVAWRSWLEFVNKTLNKYRTF